MPHARLTFAALALALSATACGGARPQQQIPEFPLKAMRSPHARGVKLYVSSSGGVDKVAVKVARAAIPEWVFEQVTAQLGAGADVEFEIEQYANGDEIYEVTRLVNGKLREAAIRGTDQAFMYMEEKDLVLADLPAPVRAALDAPPGGLEVREIHRQKRADGTDRYVISGRRQGTPLSLIFDKSGALIARRQILPGNVILSQ